MLGLSFARTLLSHVYGVAAPHDIHRSASSATCPFLAFPPIAVKRLLCRIFSSERFLAMISWEQLAM